MVREIPLAEVVVPPLKDKLLRTFKLVVVAFPKRTVVSVDDALFRFWMVELPFTMNVPGMETRPSQFTLKILVVALPPDCVVEAISKSEMKLP